MQRPRARLSASCASRARSTIVEVVERFSFPSRRRRARRRLAPIVVCTAVAFTAALLVLGASTEGRASEPARNDQAAAKSLDEQVQEIKSDVLAIAAELGNLEERLLYPSNTQVAVFVAIEEGDEVAIDSARLSVDGELVAHHIYTFKELEALQKGGVQRIYTGNVPTGSHQLEVEISGRRGTGKDFQLLERFGFDKEVDPKLIGITLGDGIAGNTTIAIEGW